MKYGDLVRFDPIEDVVQLREADKKDEARRLVETYVISDGMAKNLIEVLIPHLELNTTLDKKGLLVVGNYGTGKSHLMSVVSAVAEHADLVEHLQSDDIKEPVKKIAGQFKVIRTEIGAVRQSLRDIVCGELERNLAKIGVDYSFPPADRLVNHKDAFIAMMNAFNEKYPDKGLLLVVDELLDYLRSRQEQELILDLNFMREIGESCRLSRFRFMAGIQEALFDNPRFEFVAESMRRVQKRFESVRIVRTDVSYVVAERLLKKTPEQKAMIRHHLGKFTALYGDMNERLDEYVALYPIHPAYLEIFEKLFVVEKREILKTLSRDVKKLIEEEVPTDSPGLLSYDHYWEPLSTDTSLRTNQDIREVIEKGQILEGILNRSFQRKQYLPSAIRIVHALCVHRLTTGDVSSPIGLTPEEIRDDLCIYLPIPEQDSEFLLTTIESILREIGKTVSGQFISHNDENDMYYIDVRKDIDYDAKIEERADSLDKGILDRYYFEVLAGVMKTPGSTYVPGYRIWEHEVIWRERRAGRSGYLFFGAPNERSTAQPPRDFYIYFLQPYDPPAFTDELRSDEVFFRLSRMNETFETALRLYAGAREMFTNSSGSNRSIYGAKASEHLKTITKWLRENIITAYDVTYQGVTRPLVELAKEGGINTSGDISDTINDISAHCLAPHFEEIAPDYPHFSQVIRSKEREEAMKDAIKCISGVRVQRGIAVLDGLNLLEDGSINTENSVYARHINDLLRSKGVGQVLNRSEIIGGQRGVEYDLRFRLEPEFVVVVIAAMVYHGDVVVAYPGKKITAANFEDLTRMSVADLAAFKHLELPKEPPIEVLAELFSLLEISPRLVRNSTTHREAVKQLQERVAGLIEEVVEAKEVLKSSLTLWGQSVLDESEKEDAARKLDDLKVFLESLQRFKTEGQLRNFGSSRADVRKQEKNLEVMREIGDLAKFCLRVAPVTQYLAEAERVLPDDNPFLQSLVEQKKALLEKIRDPETQKTKEFQREFERELNRLKKEYIDEYLRLHGAARLGVEGDNRKKRLMKSPALKAIRELSSIEIMPKGDLTGFEAELTRLKPCFALDSGALENSVTCPYCQFRPADEEISAPLENILSALEDRLDVLYDRWTQTLLENLSDPAVSTSLEALKPDERKLVEDFMAAKELPEKISVEFVKAMQEVFSGLVKVTITRDALMDGLKGNGSPCTVDEFRNRFEGYIKSLTRGREERKIRIVVE